MENSNSIVCVKDLENKMKSANFDSKIKIIIKEINLDPSTIILQIKSKNSNFNFIKEYFLKLQYFVDEFLKNVKLPLINTPNIITISYYLKKQIFDIECYMDNFSNYYYDVIWSIEHDSKTIYLRWVDKFDIIDNILDFKEYGIDELKIKNKIREIICDFINKFSNCQLFESVEELYKYLKYNCIFRNNINIKKKIGIINDTIDDNIIHHRNLSIIEILECMNIRFKNLEKLKELINYLDKVLPVKKRTKSNFKNLKIPFNLVKYTWDELGSIKCLVSEWCKNN